MRGVTLATFRQYYGAHKTKDDLRKITGQQISHIYRRGYWDKLGCDRLASGVDYACFDFGVNSGVSRARSYLLKAIGGSDANTIERLCAARLKFLQGLNTWPTFGKGWTRRVHSVRQEALRMAAKATGTIPAAKPSTAPVKPGRAPVPVIGIVLAAIGAAVLAILKSKGVF